MSHPVVTVRDPLYPDDTESAELMPDMHILLLGSDLELAHEARHANGTRVLTIKKKSGDR